MSRVHHNVGRRNHEVLRAKSECGPKALDACVAGRHNIDVAIADQNCFLGFAQT